MSDVAPVVYSLSDLRTADLPEPRPIIEGLLSEGDTILLVGRPKVGKSRLVQQATLDLARAQCFLGRFTIPAARRVLLIDLENRPAGVKARFGAMSEPHESDQRVSIYAPETLAQGAINATPDGIRYLEGLVTRHTPDVVIIDTWRLFVGGDENDARVAVDGLKSLSCVRTKRPQLATIVVHHLRKERTNDPVKLRNDPYAWVEAVSGHHALVGHVDACFGLERELDANRDELIVFGGVARSAATSALLLEEDEQTLRFTVKSGSDAAEAIMTRTELAVWRQARSLPRFTFTVLLKQAKTTNKKAVSSMLRKAESHGALRKEGSEYVVLP